VDWEAPQQSRLWRYNLHYLNDLDAVGSLSNEERGALLDQWIAQNPPGRGTGWEPYPLSLRIVNTVKWIRRRNHDRDRWQSSLALQASALERNVEYHIRANHLFENAKALVFAGVHFTGPNADNWLTKGLRILDVECREQFLADGGHFELSPMYHGAMLWNLAELIQLAESSGLPALIGRAKTWRSLLVRGIEWYAAMTHPDGEISFFNDSAFGIAPELRAVVKYAEFLNCPIDSKVLMCRGERLRQLAQTGYLRVLLGNESAAIIDVGPVGPDYQPGHAHADVLSFELSLHGKRVFVNSGTSTYELGAERDTQRGTAAHNTVIVDNRNSSDTWAGFRVGRRARPRLISARTDEDAVRIAAQHDGYRRLIGGATHCRDWTWRADEVVIRDCVKGRFHSAAARYHLHPDVEASVDSRTPDRVMLNLPDGHTASFVVIDGRIDIVPSVWYPRFGIGVPNRTLHIEFLGNQLETRISWRNQE